ncbi:DUF2802 domain-containing protein [Pseudomonas matsuisoli]|uniref:Chemotaxis protein n=1 Tax=Pseudomonas matsuisoli TaxID=1515666 RepID=A0A917PIX1_9PSED|nr:DUF2802 domain-containing protein [Pseudomonas matsuisoli]GGJ80199.1 hypothetical protein GCM10009304_02400 [Pseudomonas matsuisoli]
MIEAAIGALVMLCVGLGGACFWLMQGQQKLQKSIREQAERDALHDQRIREIIKRLDTYLAGSVRMGEELHDLRKTLAPIPDKLTQIEQRDPANFSFTQAARLVGMGASIDDLTQSCGLTQAEAELVSKLHKGPKSRK